LPIIPKNALKIQQEWFFDNFRVDTTHRPGLRPEDVAPAGQPRTNAGSTQVFPKIDNFLSMLKP
jgi:hypothetical protein